MISTPFRDCLPVPGSFSIAFELVTARRLVKAERSRALVAKARTLAADPPIDVLSITDNPSAWANDCLAATNTPSRTSSVDNS